MLNELSSAAADSTKQAESLIRKLGDPSFSIRNMASQELQESVHIYWWAMRTALDDKTTSIEARARIKTILETHTSIYGEAEEFAASMQLADDPEFLIQLLDRAPQFDRELVGNQLNDLTGERFGADLGKWQAWVRSRQVNATGIGRDSRQGQLREYQQARCLA